jgi:queuine tRNA-ribosyltransferase
MGFELTKTSGHARAGYLRTDHGVVHTPVFMPVGTQATVKGVSPRSLEEIGAEIVLANTYHLVLRPGTEVIRAAGGLHAFMSWSKPILTDSGGFQVLSLADLRKVTNEGIAFRSHIDGSLHLFTPERVIEDQAVLGADIIMSFDYCTSFPCSRSEAEEAVRLTSDWARRGARAHGTRFRMNGYERVVLGIVQGSVYEDLRKRSAGELLEIGFPGYAIGGLSVGEDREVTWRIAEGVTELLPADKPRYLMGMGTPLDLVDAVARGIDMLDCVMPTRNARNGTVFTRSGRLVLRNGAYARDFKPIDDTCECYTCGNFSRAYLRHLFVAGEMLGPTLATHHSLHFYCELMREMRQAILNDRFSNWREGFVGRYESGAIDEAQTA